MATVFGPKRSLLGNIYAGGDFTDYNSTGFQYFTKLDSSGNLYSNPPYSATSFDGYVRSIVSYTSRRILIGGDFTTYNGDSRKYLISIDFEGNIDNLFRVYDYINGSDVRAIGVDKYDRVIIGGNITNYNGTYFVGNIMRLNLDGSYDTSFYTDTGFDKTVYAIAVQSDGKILVGGEFLNFSGDTSYTYLVRLNEDGSIDTTFTKSTKINNIVSSIAVDEYDGTIIVGGDFADGSNYNYLIRLRDDGGEISGFQNGLSDSVNVVKLDSKRRVLVGGKFDTTFGGGGVKKIIRYNSNNTIDYDFFTKGGFDNTVVSIDTDVNDDVYVGGAFTTYDNGSTSSPGLIKLNGTNAITSQTFNYTGSVLSVLVSNQ